jgi:hypothetical protein
MDAGSGHRERSCCPLLPSRAVIEETAWVGTRWMVRKRNFAHVLKIEDGWPPAYARAAASDGPVVVMTFRVDALAYDAFADADPRSSPPNGAPAGRPK